MGWVHVSKVRYNLGAKEKLQQHFNLLRDVVKPVRIALSALPPGL
jgi:hypothetical protein